MRAIQLFEELGNRHHAAVSYSRLAITVALRAKLVEASGWLLKAIFELQHHDDPERET